MWVKLPNGWTFVQLFQPRQYISSITKNLQEKIGQSRSTAMWGTSHEWLYSHIINVIFGAWVVGFGGSKQVICSLYVIYIYMHVHIFYIWVNDQPVSLRYSVDLSEKLRELEGREFGWDGFWCHDRDDHLKKTAQTRPRRHQHRFTN